MIDSASTGECTEVGKTRVKVLGNLGIADRNKRKVEKELDTLARNAAVDLAGNAVAPASSIEDGERSYLILQCTDLR